MDKSRKAIMISKKIRLNLTAASLIAALGTSPLAFADHNSVWGEGWANMPNDIHNTRIDTMDEDSSVFQEFVSHGAGADSVNRFLDDDTDSSVSSRGSNSMGGSSVDAGSSAVSMTSPGGGARSGGSRR